MKKKIITIAGVLGSGKSSTARLLSQELGYIHKSMGDLQREYSEKLGMDFTSYGEMQKKDHSIDKKIDEYQKKFGSEHEEFVLDSRLGWFFIPDSFKVCLMLDEVTAAKRIVADAQNNSTRKVEQVEDVDSQIIKNRKRVESERVRYKDLYNISDHFDSSHFDLVVHTDVHTLEEVVAIIKSAYEDWIKTS